MLDKKLVSSLRDEYALCLAKALRDRTIDVVPSRKATREFLDLLAEAPDQPHLKEALRAHVKKWPALAGVLLFLMHKEEETMLKEVLEKMREHLRQNQIDEAIRVGRTVK